MPTKSFAQQVYLPDTFGARQLIENKDEADVPLH
jgi:hypothetical protein